MVLTRLRTLIIKELQILIRNRSTLVLLILPVFIQALFFPFAATLELNNSTLAIYAEEQSAFSIELSERLSTTAAFSKIIIIHDDATLKTVIDTQQALVALRIPQNFTASLTAQNPAAIQVILDGRRANSAQIAFSYVTRIIQSLAEERGINQSPIILVPQHFFNPNLNFKWFILPTLVAIITTIGCLMVTALSLAREREEGTYDQLLVSPLTPLYIMVGKAIPAVMVAVIQGTIITLVARYFYHVPLTGSLTLHYSTMGLYALSLTGFGLFISALSHTQQQAFLGVFFFMVPAVVLSGFMAPIENMPTLLYGFVQINPLMHYIEIVKGVFLKSYTLYDAWPHIWPLMMITILMFTIAYYLFTRKIH